MRTRRLAAQARAATAALVAHLAELETRGLHLCEGFGSLFAYCRDALFLSEHEAYLRIEAARAARSFPTILDRLAEGAINLTTVKILRPHLSPENHAHLLDSARGKTKAQVEQMVAALVPLPDVPVSIRKLPVRTVTAPMADVPAEPAAEHPTPTALATPPVAPPVRPAAVTPLAPDRYKLQLTISGEALEKLRLAKDLLRHAVPSGDDAAIVERALSSLLADLARKKFAATAKPRAAVPASKPGSRHVPAAVKRSVFLRDLGRCAFVGTNGRRCNERGFLEFHHRKPYAVGGEASVANIELRCCRHNAYEARVYFVGDRLNNHSFRNVSPKAMRGADPPG